MSDMLLLSVLSLQFFLICFLLKHTLKVATSMHLSLKFSTRKEVFLNYLSLFLDISFKFQPG